MTVFRDGLLIMQKTGFEMEMMIMLTKDMLKKTFLAICEKADIKEEAVMAYEDALDEKFDEAGIPRDSEEAKKAYAEVSEKCLPWIVDRMVTDEVVRYINENMELVPIVSVPKDSDIDILFRFANREIALVGLMNEVVDENSKEHCEFFPYLFPMKACNVSGFIVDECGNNGGFKYIMGFITYILEDGSFVTVDEKSYGYYDDEDDDYIFRKVIDRCPSLCLLDDMFADKSQGFFSW